MKTKLTPLGTAIKTALERMRAGLDTKNINKIRASETYLFRVVDEWTAPMFSTLTISQLRRVIHNAKREIQNRGKPKNPSHRPEVSQQRINEVAGLHAALTQQHGLSSQDAKAFVAVFRFGSLDAVRTVERDLRAFRQKAKNK